MTAPEGCTGNVWSAVTGAHPGFDMPPEPGTRLGTDVVIIDGPSIGALIGSAFDGCIPCQTHWLDRLQADPIATVRLVELAAQFTQDALGGVPARMTTTDPESMLSEPFRAMVRLGVDAGEDHRPMLDEARRLDVAGRRAAIDDAVDMIVGHMGLGL